MSIHELVEKVINEIMEVQDGDYLVTATAPDPIEEGKECKHIYICGNAEEATRVFERARRVPDLKYVTACRAPLEYFRKTHGIVYHVRGRKVVIKTRYTEPTMYAI